MCHVSRVKSPAFPQYSVLPAIPERGSAGMLLLAALEGIARYAGLRLAPAESLILPPRLFSPLGKKRELFPLFVLILGHFLCSVETSVIFSSNRSNFENNKKKICTNKKKSQKS